MYRERESRHVSQSYRRRSRSPPRRPSRRSGFDSYTPSSNDTTRRTERRSPPKRHRSPSPRGEPSRPRKQLKQSCSTLSSNSSSPVHRSSNERFSGDIYAYEFIRPIAEGAFGAVFLAQAKTKQVAIKKLKLSQRERETKLYEREIDVLQTCSHSNIVQLLELASNTKGDLFLVFEYLDYDLKQLFVFCPEQVMHVPVAKRLTLHLLKGLSYLHAIQVMHRDIKPRNLLVSKRGVLKIADLGSVKRWVRGGLVSPDCVTLRYRCPEILLGSDDYDLSVDCWSVGCIVAEMLNAGKPLFPVTTEMQLLKAMCETLGTPTDATLPGLSTLPGMKHLQTLPSQLLTRHPDSLPSLSSPSFSSSFTSVGLDFVGKLLTYNPAHRLNALDAQLHGWFAEEPKMAEEFIPVLANEERPSS